MVEVPITFVEREHGESKMSGTIVREALVKVDAVGRAQLPASASSRRDVGGADDEALTMPLA